MSIVLWIGFIVFVLAMLAIDLGLFNREARTVSPGRAIRWTALCIALALLFNIAIYFIYEYRILGISEGVAVPLTGREAAMQFFTGWLIEQSLSLDNVFVIAIIFSYFRVPLQYQHRVLFWGIVGALVMRGAMIALGVTLIRSFGWINYVFGALLLYAAIKILLVKEGDMNPEKNILFRLGRRLFRVSSGIEDERFITRVDGRLAITPLFLVLLIIESTDVLFAIDSIPAVFAITQDPFIVFTSNIFAILNLRSLYFALASFMDRFAYLKISLVCILLFVGVKLMISHHLHIPTEVSFGVILGAIAIGIGASIVSDRHRRPAEAGKIE